MVDASIIFRAVNCAVGALMILGGIWQILFATGILGFPRFISGIYFMIFGVATLLYEFRLPTKITQYTSFMFSFLGRGVFYIFIGCLILNTAVLSIIAGTIIIFVGVAFVFFEFYPVIDPPANMRTEAFNANGDSPFIVPPSQHAANNPYSFSGTGNV